MYIIYDVVGAFKLLELRRCEYSCGRRAAVRLLQAQGQEATDAAVYLNSYILLSEMFTIICIIYDLYDCFYFDYIT